MSALLTDHYELTMVQAALADGTADRPSVFELFGRRLSGGRRYGVVAGLGRFLDELKSFRFEQAELDFLAETRVVDEATLAWLADYRFSGDIWAYPEGELYFPHSPVMVVESTFAEGVLLETLALSILNHDSAIATAAARMTSAAGGRPCFEMGSRRTHEQAAVAAARAAHVAGFAATSNLEAGRRYGIPTMGTAAHSFTLLHDDERSAFESQVAALGAGTTLLVDTYDVAQGVRTAVDVAGPELGGVRIDSGDLGAMARDVRAQLDALGAHDTKITVTSDLDEFAIASLAAAPVDGYGVGTSLVTGSGVPTSGFVYKLVARATAAGEPLEPVAKRSKDKASYGGRKYAARRLDAHGVAEAEVIGVEGAPATDANDRPLHVQYVAAGEATREVNLSEARATLESARAELPPAALRLSKGDPALPTVFET